MQGTGPARRAVILGAAAVAVAAVAWWAVASRSGDPTRSEPESAAMEAQDATLAAKPAPPANRRRAGYAPAPTGPVSLEVTAGAVSATVVDEKGRGLPDVPLHLVPTDEDTDPWPASSEGFDLRPRITNAEGRARWDRVPMRQVRLKAEPPEGCCAEPVMVAVGGPAATVRVVPLARTVVRVLDPNGKPVAGLGVEFTWGSNTDAEEAAAREGRKYWSSTWSGEEIQCFDPTSAEGEASLRLPPTARPGRLRLQVPDAYAPVVLYPWAPADLTVRLEPAMDLEGTVEDDRGERVTEGEIVYRPSNGRVGVARVEYDGTFQITKIPPGPVALRHRSETAPTTESARETTAKAGATDVVVRAELGASLAIQIAGWPREAGGYAVLTPEPRTGAPPKEIRADVELDGTVRFRGLVRGAKYVLWVPPSISGLQKTTDQGPVGSCVYRTGLEASEDVVGVELTAGRTIDAKVALPAVVPGRHVANGEDGPWWGVTGGIRERGLRLEAAYDLHGGLRLVGVPEGVWTLAVRATCEVRVADPRVDVERTWWAGEGPVGGPETPTIALRSVPPPKDDEGGR